LPDYLLIGGSLQETKLKNNTSVVAAEPKHWTIEHFF
jgi:hypothetical protein